MLFESPSIRVELDDQIATLWFDCHDRAENRLSRQFLDEFELALQTVQRIPCVDLLVIRSSKSNGFSPGFAVDELQQLETAGARSAFAGRGQQVLQLLNSLGPNTITVAVIDGPCRNAGLELALACDYRIATMSTATIFGSSQVNNGSLPCWGGTWRLPQLIGMKAALRMLLTGRELSAGEARKCGLVDLTTSEPGSRAIIQAFLEKLQDSPRRPTCPRRLIDRIRDRLPIARWSMFRHAQRWLADVDASDRPAAWAVLNAMQAGVSSGSDACACERRSFAELGDTLAYRNGLARTRLAEQPARLYPEPLNPIPPAPQRIGIVGGGELGSALACFFSLRGRQVVLREACEDSLQLAGERLDRRFQQAVADGIIPAAKADQLKKTILRTSAWNGIEEASLVIDCTDEDLGVKLGVFQELEERVRPRTILATASSTLRVEALQAELQRPGRVAGLHFLNDSLQAPLVEIVRAPATDVATLACLDAWLREWGHTPIIVSDRPGRLVKRVELAYLSEAVLLVAEGLPPELIDREMRRFGMAQGPLETIDAMGFDNLARFVENLQIARGDAFARNLLLDRMRAIGWTGRESGDGFYSYRRGRAKHNHLARMIMWRDTDEDVVSHYVFDPAEALETGVERMVLRTINEAAACLADERDADAALVDLALALGAGWAPHRGGPLCHADELGLVSVVERLTEFAERFGKRFEPCVELQRRAEAGESFDATPVPAEIVPFPLPRRMAG